MPLIYTDENGKLPRMIADHNCQKRRTATQTLTADNADVTDLRRSKGVSTGRFEFV